MWNYANRTINGWTLEKGKAYTVGVELNNDISAYTGFAETAELVDSSNKEGTVWYYYGYFTNLTLDANEYPYPYYFTTDKNDKTKGFFFGASIFKERESRTITFDANGGSNAPNVQTEYIGNDIIIPNTIPSKDFYDVFIGWATSQDGAVVYRAGDIYSENESITLYAVWKTGYPVTAAVDSIKPTEVTVTCSSYYAFDTIKYSTNGGVDWKVISVDIGTNAQITISNLTPNTPYNIQIQVNGNEMWTTYQIGRFITPPINTISVLNSPTLLGDLDGTIFEPFDLNVVIADNANSDITWEFGAVGYDPIINGSVEHDSTSTENKRKINLTISVSAGNVLSLYQNFVETNSKNTDNTIDYTVAVMDMGGMDVGRILTRYGTMDLPTFYIRTTEDGVTNAVEFSLNFKLGNYILFKPDGEIQASEFVETGTEIIFTKENGGTVIAPSFIETEEFVWGDVNTPLRAILEEI